MTSQCFCMNRTPGREGVHGNMVNAVADLGVRVGHELGVQATVDGPPRLAAIVGAERARSRDCDVHPLRVLPIQNNRVQAQSTGAWLPIGSGPMAAESCKLMPGLSAICGAEQCGVFYSGIDSVRIRERWFEVPDALELPGVLCAVVPLVCSEGLTGGGRGVIDEFVALPCRRGAGRRHHFPAGSFPSVAAVA